MPIGGGPGADDLFDPRDLDDIRTRVVLPVLASLISRSDLNWAELRWGGPLDAPHHLLEEPAQDLDPCDDSQDLWVLMKARGQTGAWQIWQPSLGQHSPDDTLGVIAFALAQRVEEWADDNLAWGEDHLARYVIPARSRRPAAR